MRLLVVEDEQRLAAGLGKGSRPKVSPSMSSTTALTASGWRGKTRRRDHPRRDAAPGERLPGVPDAAPRGQIDPHPDADRQGRSGGTRSRVWTPAPTTASAKPFSYVVLVAGCRRCAAAEHGRGRPCSRPESSASIPATRGVWLHRGKQIDLETGARVRQSSSTSYTIPTRCWRSATFLTTSRISSSTVTRTSSRCMCSRLRIKLPRPGGSPDDRNRSGSRVPARRRVFERLATIRAGSPRPWPRSSSPSPSLSGAISAGRRRGGRQRVDEGDEGRPMSRPPEVVGQLEAGRGHRASTSPAATTNSSFR